MSTNNISNIIDQKIDLALKKWHGHSITSQEISDLSGVKRKTIEQTLVRALNKIRANEGHPVSSRTNAHLWDGK